MRILASFLCFALASCATAPSAVPSDAAAAKPQATSVKPICSSVKTYTNAEGAALAAAVAALSPTSILVIAMADYARMRDEARACLAKG